MGCARSWIAAGTLALATVCHADTRHAINVGTGQVWCDLVGKSEHDVVSGTKVEFGLRFGHVPTRPGQSGATWSHMRLANVHVEIGPWSVFQQAGPYGDGLAPLPAQDYRFASTFFSHGSSIGVRVRATFQLGILMPPVYPFFGAFLPVASQDLDRTFGFSAYNRLQLLGTERDEATGAVDSVYTELATAGLGAAQASLGTHQTSPAAPALAETKSAILAGSTLSTAFVTTTHGYYNSLSQSDLADVVPFVLVSPGEDFYTFVGNKTAAQPLHNLVAAWSCKTLGGGSLTGPSAFRILDLNGANPRVNSAYLGFTQSISAKVFAGSAWVGIPEGSEPPVGTPFHNLGLNVATFFSELSSGCSFKEAADRAFALYPPMYSNQVWTRLRMTIIGDQDATLSCVYLTAAEIQAAGGARTNVNRWWVRLPVSL